MNAAWKARLTWVAILLVAAALYLVLTVLAAAYGSVEQASSQGTGGARSLDQEAGGLARDLPELPPVPFAGLSGDRLEEQGAYATGPDISPRAVCALSGFNTRAVTRAGVSVRYVSLRYRLGAHISEPGRPKRPWKFLSLYLYEGFCL